jgi:hypothetical protein
MRSMKSAPDYHPLANIFPLIEGAEFDALRDDVKAYGLREPVVMLEKHLLHGRNRWRACEAAGMEMPGHMIRQFDLAVDGDPLEWVISKNLKRRHLNESQRAMVAAKIANLPLGGAIYRSANLPTDRVSQAAASNMLNVGDRSIRSAITVRDKAEPELKHAVEQGHLAVSVAAAAAKLPAEDQREIAQKGVTGMSAYGGRTDMGLMPAGVCG